MAINSFTASLTFRCHKATTARYTGTIVDETGAGIDAADLTTLTLTLYNWADKSIINSRDAQNVLNANNVTVDASGNLVWTLQPADNPIVSGVDGLESELHIALFEWTWGVGRQGNHEVAIRTINIYGA